MATGEETAVSLPDGNQATGKVDDLVMYNAIVEKVWELLDRTLTLPDIAAAISAEFGLSRERALADTRELIDIFSRADFVTTGHRPSPSNRRSMPSG